MRNQEKWDEFLCELHSSAIDGYRNSKEYEYVRQRQEHIDEMLTTKLAAENKNFVEDILFDLGVIAEREAEVIYQQGLKDGVWLLRNLGMLS